MARCRAATPCAPKAHVIVRTKRPVELQRDVHMLGADIMANPCIAERGREECRARDTQATNMSEQCESSARSCQL